MSFVHLHNHTEYSLLDGACRVKDLVSTAKAMGMPAVAVTDHGNMFASIQVFNECKAQGIKPIIGCEVYVAPHHRNRFFKQKVEGEKPRHHLILLCKDATGYKNLCKLVTAGYSEGFYGRPRIDKELLSAHHEGLVCLSACIAGEVPSLILNDKIDEARAEVEWYKNLFGEDYYIEIQNHGLADEKKVLPWLISLANEYNIKLVATNDAHYIKKTDAWWHDLLLCVGTKSTVDQPNRFKFPNDEFYFKSEEEMLALFPDHPEAISNTLEVAEKCNFEFEFGKVKLPYYDIPEGYASHYDYLRDLTIKGMERRYGKDIPETHLERMEYELSVINSMGFVSYYLIVWDFINWAKSHDIPVGPGRGSGAGSIVAYAIGITDIDPIRFNLFFERFLNPERVSMPDFDIGATCSLIK